MSFEERLGGVYPDALRFARALAGSEADGDDLLQDALVRAWRAYPRLREPDRFKCWLLRIVRNAHRTRSRKAALWNWLSLNGNEDIPVPAGLPFEEKDAVRRALSRVPGPQREALVLFEVMGMTVEEIAEVQGKSVSAVKSRLARGRGRLRDAWGRLANAGGDR